MADQFQSGQTVRLKSGGPIMTVVNYGDYYGVRKIQCRWFDDKNKLQTDTFTDAELEAASTKVSFDAL